MKSMFQKVFILEIKKLLHISMTEADGVLQLHTFTLDLAGLNVTNMYESKEGIK